MEELGKKYISNMNNKLKSLPKELRRTLSKLNWEDGEIQERIMRLGIEASRYNIDVDNRNDLIDMARATIIEDKIAQRI